MSSSPVQPSTLDGLPKQFVNAMRTLFEIMDDKKSGLVNLADIENRWQDDGSKGLPKGVLESLRKVTPPNGMLTFERFCAGLKICLLRNQVERRNGNEHQLPEKRPQDGVGGQQANRPPSAPLLDIDGTQNWPNAVAIRPNNVMSPTQRTISMPQLHPDRKEALAQENKALVNPKPLYGPPKPPRTAIGVERSAPIPVPAAPTTAAPNMDRAEIRNALQNWQMGLLMGNDQDKGDKRNAPQQYRRSLGDGKAAIHTDNGAAPATGLYQKKTNVRRREPRRHTLQNGIDYNMLKRMKQIEQEKDVLMQGLSAVDKAREWYLKQVTAVQEKMKYLGRMGHVEPWSEAQQERLELQRARVFEVNRHLAALTDSWERGGLPLHMNLAVHHYPQSHDLSDRLKHQNRLLTEEVSKKSERISALEREKASLIQVIQMRSSSTTRNTGQEEAVF